MRYRETGACARYRICVRERDKNKKVLRKARKTFEKKLYKEVKKNPKALYRTSRCSGERSFQYSAPRLYNKLPVEIKDSENINQFKKRLKTYLFGESYDMNQKTINEQYKI